MSSRDRKSHRRPIRVDLQGQWLGTVDQGKMLELSAVGNPGRLLGPLATVFADEADERLFIEIYTEAGPVEIPADQLRQALDAAKGEAHSERWYEQNVSPRFRQE